jgi:hypothetical protein
MGMRETDECPRCGEPEDSTHLWQCSDQGTEIAWYRWQRELEVWWRKSDTNPALGDAMIQAVELWRIGDPGTVVSTCPRIEEAIQHQHRIGWRAFLEGKWAPEWRELYAEMGGSKRDTTWAKTVIDIGWRTGWAIWEQRNDLIHRKESEVANQVMNARITELKAMQWRYLLSDEARWATCPHEEIMSWGVPKRQQWINRMEAILARKEREANQGPLAQMRRTMRNFLDNARNGTVGGAE